METVRSVHLNLNFSSHFSLVLITFLSGVLPSGLWPMKITFHNVNDRATELSSRKLSLYVDSDVWFGIPPGSNLLFSSYTTIFTPLLHWCVCQDSDKQGKESSVFSRKQ